MYLRLAQKFVGRRCPRWRVVTWSREIDMASAPAMLARTLHASRRGDNVVVDLGPVQFMDSAGLDALVSAHSQIRDRDRQLLIRNVSPKVLWMLELFELTDLLESTVAMRPCPLPARTPPQRFPAALTGGTDTAA